MKPLLYLIQKEFRQVFRDPAMVRIVFVLPLIQLFIFGYAANTDLKNVRLAVLDQDHTVESRRLVDSYFASDLFIPAPRAKNPAGLNELLAMNRADATLWIPNGYARYLADRRPVNVAIQINGTNATLAGQAGGYSNAIVRGEMERILKERSLENTALKQKMRTITPVTRFFYNPELESRKYMVPGIVVLIITIISGMLTGMAVVREKEIGTLEQLMVSPLTPFQLIAGKTIPFAILSYGALAFSTLVAILWFHIPLTGSVILLAGVMLIYLLVTLGGGLLASTVSHTQQQALFTVWFFLVFGIIMSGFFFPVQNMPDWAQYLTYLNPLRYMMNIVRGIFLRGATLPDIIPDLLPLATIGVVSFSFAVLRFRKKLA